MPRLSPDDPRLAAPDFPHGDIKGYTRGCSCTPCRAANAEKTAQRKALVSGRDRSTVQGSRVDGTKTRLHIQGLLDANPALTRQNIAEAAGVNPTVVHYLMTGRAKNIASATEEFLTGVTLAAAEARMSNHRRPVEPTRDRIKKLMEHPYGTYRNIATAVGVEPDIISAIAEGKRAYIYKETEDAVAAVTPDRVQRAAAFIPARIPETQIRALQANGWPLPILYEMDGHKWNGFRFLYDRTTKVTQDVARRIAALYEQIGDQTGPNPRTAAWARAKGYYPPIHYDDDMNLIRESIRRPYHVVTGGRQARARKWLRIMGLTVREHTGAEIADMISGTEKTVERTRKVIGLRLESNPHRIHLDLPFIKDGQDDLVAAITEATSSIVLSEPTDAHDMPDTDYLALWEALVTQAERIQAGNDGRPRLDLVDVA